MHHLQAFLIRLCPPKVSLRSAHVPYKTSIFSYNININHMHISIRTYNNIATYVYTHKSLNKHACIIYYMYIASLHTYMVVYHTDSIVDRYQNINIIILLTLIYQLLIYVALNDFGIDMPITKLSPLVVRGIAKIYLMLGHTIFITNNNYTGMLVHTCIYINIVLFEKCTA